MKKATFVISTVFACVMAKGQTCFYAAPNLTLNSPANAITSSDFNGDGNNDLAVGGTGGVQIFLGDGNGNFQTGVFVPQGGGFNAIISVVAEDVNQDNFKDLLFLNVNGSAKVALGGGNGTFTLTGLSYWGCSHPLSLHLDDFNNDSKPDLIITNFCSGSFTRFLGNGTGGFGIGHNPPLATSINCYDASSGDFDGDGNKDLAYADFLTNRIRVVNGSPTGSFVTAPVNYTVGSQPKGITIADYNSDGNNDLAVSLNGTDSLAILFGSPSGTFSPVALYQVNSLPESIESKDMDGDGDIDLIVAHSNSVTGSVSILLNSSGSFMQPLSYQVGLKPSGLTTNDFNGDGFPDFATSNKNDNSVSIWLSAYPKITASPSVCAGNTINLSATAIGGASFSWVNGPNSSTWNPSPTVNTTYSVVVTSSICTKLITKDIEVKILPNVNVSSSKPVICKGETAILTATGANTYLWNLMGAITPSLLVSPTVNFNYTVTGTDSSGCSKTSTFTQSVNICTQLTNASQAKHSIKVSPNPSHGVIAIKGLDENALYTFEIFNMLGQRVCQGDVTNGKEIDLGHQPKGVYIYKTFENGKALHQGKLILE